MNANIGAPNSLYWLMVQTSKMCPLAWGGPGIGKTETHRAFDLFAGRMGYALIGSLREPSDIGGFPYPHQTEITDPVTGQRVFVRFMAIMPPKWAADACDGRKWHIFYDETTGNAPAVQSALMAAIAENRIGDLVLPDDTWRSAAANPVEQAANGFDLEPPLANRMPHLEWERDDEADDQGMITGDYPPPAFPTLPEDWKNHCVAVGGRIAAFRQVRPNLRYAYPTDQTSVSKAWPSPRTWRMAKYAMAAVEAVEAVESVGLHDKNELAALRSTCKSLRYRAVTACVGQAACHEFKAWEDSLDLPDPEAWIAEAIAARAEQRDLNITFPPRSDQVMACLTSLAGRIRTHGRKADGPDRTRWEAGADIFTLALQDHRELAVATAKALYSAWEPLDMPKDLMAPVELTEAFYGILTALGKLKG